MSVRLFSEQEIADMFHAAMAMPQRLRGFRDEQGIREALQSALIANAAAFSMTYREKTSTQIADFAMPTSKRLNRLQLETGIGLLLYNCVSNGGRDFLPEQDRAVLMAIRLAILEDAAEEARLLRA